MRLVLWLFVCLLPVHGETEVTSKDQFQRLMPDGLPNELGFDDDSTLLAVPAAKANCKSAERGFFEFHVNQNGAVVSAKWKESSHGSMATQAQAFVKKLLLRLRFKPLLVARKPVGVKSYATVVCN
jgi:hypothetical protein